jgi:hypothetical protein
VPHDLLHETLIALAEAARLIPAFRGGGRTSPPTVYRWVTKGARAPDGRTVRLEAVRLGGRYLTSREALSRFAEALTPTPSTAATEPSRSAPRTPVRRRREAERAARELERAGIR